MICRSSGDVCSNTYYMLVTAIFSISVLHSKCTHDYTCIWHNFTIIWLYLELLILSTNYIIIYHAYDIIIVANVPMSIITVIMVEWNMANVSKAIPESSITRFYFITVLFGTLTFLQSSTAFFFFRKHCSTSFQVLLHFWYTVWK